jgi:hypothetical protein
MIRYDTVDRSTFLSDRDDVDHRPKLFALFSATVLSTVYSIDLMIFSGEDKVKLMDVAVT